MFANKTRCRGGSDMLAFVQPVSLFPPSPVFRKGTVERSIVPHAVAARDERVAPSSIDELVRGWFTPGGWPGRRQDSSPRKDFLSSSVSGPSAATTGVAHYLLSTTIVARSDKASVMAELLRELQENASECGPDEGPLVCAVNQSPEDPNVFIVFERFSSSESMTKHQKGSLYQKFIRECQPLLEKPFGVHICKEVDGKVSMAYHPFGPAGMYSQRLRSSRPFRSFWRFFLALVDLTFRLACFVNSRRGWA